MDFIQPDLPFFGIMTSFIGGRRENQDTCGYSETERGLLVVVCDGMGGGPGGKTASRLAVEAIIGYVKTNSQPPVCDNTHSDTAEASPETPAPQPAVASIPNTPVANADILREAVQAANTALRTYIQLNPSFDGMGTTVTAMLINKDGAAVAHVGDSRIYQLRHKKIVFRTGDHSEVGKMVRNGILTEEQARLSAISNIITRAVGIADMVEVDTATLVVQPGDRFVLCTDGVWGAMPEPELVKMFCAKGALDTVARNINDKVEEAGIEKGGRHDNFSMIMVMALKDADTAVIAEASSVKSLKADTGSDNKKIVLSLPKPGPRTIAATAVAMIVLLAIVFLWKPWAKDTQPTQEQTTEQTDVSPEQQTDEATTGESAVMEETEQGQEPKTPSDVAADATQQTVEKKDTTPMEKPSETKAKDSDPKKELLAALPSKANPDSLLRKYRCYQSTLATIHYVDTVTQGLLKDQDPDPKNVTIRGEKKEKMRAAVINLKGKFNGIYTADEQAMLFDEKTGKNKALYGALGNSKLVKRNIDESDWKGACNSVINMCIRLKNEFKKALEAVIHELEECGINPATGEPTGEN